MMISKLAASIGGVFKSTGLRSAVHCAAIGGAALMAFAPAAHAVVVTTTYNIAVPATTQGIYVNVVTGVSNIVPASAPGWDINPYSTTGLSFFNPTTPTGGVYVVSVAGQVANLAIGSVVGTTTPLFGSGAATTTAAASPWVLNATNYFGFRFTNEANSQVHYGFGTMIIGSSLLTRTLGTVSYESIPGASITVSPVPEPASVAMMLLGGLGVAGVAARRRRQSAA